MRKQFPRGLCITKTPMNGYWQQYIPDDFIHDAMNEMLLQKFLEIQASWTKASRENPESQINPNAFLILEDCVDQTFRFDTVVEKVFYLGRHVKVACFVASQW